MSPNVQMSGAKRLTVKPPHMRKAELPEVELSVVEVREVGGPGDGTDVHWRLLSSLPVGEVDMIQRIIDIYVKRWPIETFFRIYKTGCRVEEIQLETNTRQRRALMIYKVVAWGLMYLTTLGRECRELDCEAVFGEFEWKPVWKVARSEPLPSSRRVWGMIFMIGELGGATPVPRRPAGSEAMWNRLRRMKHFSLAWQAFGRSGNYDLRITDRPPRPRTPVDEDLGGLGYDQQKTGCGSLVGRHPTIQSLPIGQRRKTAGGDDGEASVPIIKTTSTATGGPPVVNPAATIIGNVAAATR